MKRTALRWIAAASILVAWVGILAPMDAARRPRYGGELRIETRLAPKTLDPVNEELAELPWLTGAVFETLVKLDQRGDPQPWLATSWAHDAARKVWVFTPRADLVLHNGSTFAAGPITIADDKPIEQILRDLSRPKSAIVIHEADGSVIGTGPFRIVKWEAGKSATLAAHEAYWGGAPYLDTVQIRFAREAADQVASLQLEKADVIDGSLPLKKRPQTRSNSVLAIHFDSRVSDAIREAVALSIDRSAIHTVILQRQGESSAALLPEWLSGYAFLFPKDRNLARAKQLTPNPVTITWTYDAKDALIRSIAQRIEVNLREVGITLRAGTGSSDAKLVELPVTSVDPMVALNDIASMLKTTLTGTSAYEIEHALLTGYRVIPIVHVPKVWSLSPRVRNWPRVEDVWIE